MYQGNFFVMRKEEDRKYMEMALGLAGKGLGHVDPNPMVGAVIVRDGRVLSAGWHRKYGSLHAERDALSSCPEDPAGATMYVTLEPCCHYGKQPPCTSAIIEAGISRVVMAMYDPNPLVAGHGAELLREKGIEVVSGLCEAEARYLNRVFVKYISEGLPWVVHKTAMTLDGHIATVSGDSRWVSCEESRRTVHEMRGHYTGIMAGIGTVLADDPMLNCRIDGMRQPVRIIVDSLARLSCDSAIARSAETYRTVLAHTAAAGRDNLEKLRGCGIMTIECASGKDGKVNLHDLMRRLGQMSVNSILLEGGAALVWSMISEGLVDEHYIFVAPKISGGENAKCPVGGAGFDKMRQALQVDVESVTQSGTDWLFHCFPADRTPLPVHEKE